MKAENNLSKDVKLAVEVIKKFGCPLREFSESLNKSVKVFRESKTVFDELKKVKLIK